VARKKQSDEAAPVTTGRKKKSAPAKARSAPVAKKRAPRAAAVRNGEGKVDLVIVESPKKAQTINKYLGPGYRVLASYGHVRDLPKRRRRGEMVAGVDIEAGWVPTYVVEERDDKGGKGRRSPKDILAELKREAAKANLIYLATDPDREGEAIAWHIEDELKLAEARTFRIAFNEITRSAVQHALANPGKIDMARVDAQEARRILDRIVGFPLSGLLGKKVAKGLSAGRVQSVALRLVVDREREIEAFKTEEYWKITALLAPEGTVPFTFKPFSVVEARSRKEKSEEGSNGKGKEVSDKEEKPDRTEAALFPQVPPGAFLAELAEWGGKKFAAANEESARRYATALDRATYVVSRVEQKDRPEKAPPPFTTSTLQQQASLRLRFGARHTMHVAQRLYEGVDLGSEGSVALITYMRTDSTRVSNEALQAVRGHIGTAYGANYLPGQPNVFASGKSAQEAHEAIRPTDVANTPQRVAALGLHGDLLKLYTLIFNRFVASQMTPAVFAVTNVEVTATPQSLQDVPKELWPERRTVDAEQHKDEVPSGLFKAQGRVLKFDGYRRVLASAGKQEDATLPPLAEQQKLDRLDLIASRHWTQPPPRYNEASLIRALEKEGIGRPSTYASILEKITGDRGYIEVKERRFFATDLGKKVTDLLVQHFPNVMDLKFTSHFEEELDEIETRKCQRNDVLDEFWGPFKEALDKAEAEMPSQRGVETGEMCPRCGRPLERNFSKKTKREFVGCSGFRDKENPCKYIKPAEGEEALPEPEVTDIACPTCGKPMLKKAGRWGEYLTCSDDTCKTKMSFNAEGKPVLSARPTEHVCEKCGKPMVLREGRRGPFLGCTGYPKCRNLKNVDAEGNPVAEFDPGIACEKCGKPMKVRTGRRGPFLGCSAYPKCKGTKPMPDDLKEKYKASAPPPAAKPTVPQVEVTETCPECGGPMKVLPSRFGGYFLGCADYPRCKGKRKATPEILEQLQAPSAV
jgi:DNA topoisomerase-1